MWEAEALRNRMCLPLENTKQNTFASKNNLDSMRAPRIHKEKGSEIHKKMKRPKSEFY